MAASTEQQEAPERQDDEGNGSEAGGTPMLEWVVGGVSAVLVLGMLAFIVVEGMIRDERPPDLRAVADSVVPVSAGHLLLFTIHNEGGETAAQVQVSGTLLQGTDTVEESEAMFDYVPIGARRHGAMQFQRALEGMEVELRVTGFSEP